MGNYGKQITMIWLWVNIYFVMLIDQINYVNFMKKMNFHQKKKKFKLKCYKKVLKIRERVFIEIFIYYIFVGSTTGTAAVYSIE